MSIEKRENRIRSVSGVVAAYEGHYSINHRAKSVAFSSSRLVHVTRLLGTALLQDLTEDAIRGYVKTRLVEGAGGRTINMELANSPAPLVTNGPCCGRRFASWKSGKR